MFKLPENLKSKYEFVTLAAKRAEQLQTGALPRVDRDTNKVTAGIGELIYLSYTGANVGRKDLGHRLDENF